MNKKITLLVLLCISFATFAQEKIKGNKVITTVKTDLEPFNKIVVKNDFEISLQKAETSFIEIETDENIHDAIIVSVIDKTLTISTSMRIRESKKLILTVNYSSPLQEITVKEDAEINSLTALKTPEMLLNINDYATANLTVQTDDFTLKNTNKSRIQLRAKSKLNISSKKIHLFAKESSSSDITVHTDSLNVVMSDRANLNVTGSANFIASTTTDSSDFDGKSLNTKNANPTLKGSSSFSILASDKVTIISSDKAKTEVYGTPEIILSRFTGSSKLFKKELKN